MRAKIQHIKDADTLTLIAEVCQSDYPEVSDTASNRVDILTMATGNDRRLKLGYRRLSRLSTLISMATWRT